MATLGSNFWELSDTYLIELISSDSDWELRFWHNEEGQFLSCFRFIAITRVEMTQEKWAESSTFALTEDRTKADKARGQIYQL